MILACDQYEETTRLAWGNTPEEVEPEEYEGQTESVRRIQELGKTAERIVVPEGSPLAHALAREGVMVSPVRRLEAAYWGLREQVNGADCLILSLGQKCCVGGVVKEGRFTGEFAGSPGLGLRDLCEEWVERVQTLRLGIENVFGGKSTTEAKEEFFRDLMKVLRGEKSQFPLLTSPLSLVQAAGPYLKAWKAQLQGFLAQLDPRREIKILVCTDWAATGSLPDLFAGDYRVVVSGNDPLTDIVRGMFQFGRESAQVVQKQASVLTAKDQKERRDGMAHEGTLEPNINAALRLLLRRIERAGSIRDLEDDNVDQEVKRWSCDDPHIGAYLSLLLAHKYERFGYVQRANDFLEFRYVCPDSSSPCEHCARLHPLRDLQLALLRAQGLKHLEGILEQLRERPIKKAYYVAILRRMRWWSG